MNTNLKNTINYISTSLNDYNNRLAIYQSNYNKIRNDYSDLKSLVELNPSVTDFLKLLQLKQHENSVGTYEKLLTSLLMEVLPGYREVILNLTTVRQSPALDVLIKKDPNNPAEDVIRGTGGSVTNIIVAGFRIISVVRSGKRKFLLLDEADCWLKDDYFPSFSKMLKEVSEKLGVQILLISHDKNSYFSGVIDHQVEIYKDNDGKIQSKFNELPDWDVEEDIIKSIRLENFQSHEDTFIPLSPTITILRGDNDLGKSSIASAFRSVFYGEGAGTDIKHFTNKSTVTVEFNNEGKCLIWERKAKGSPVETYTCYSNIHGYESPLHKTEGLSRGNVPEWLMEETGLGKFDELDVQLTWQKEPLAFLSAGPHIRAKALAIGAEADHVQKMMLLSKKKNTENKALLKSQESLIENQRQYIVLLKNSSKVDREYFSGLNEKLEVFDDKKSKLSSVINELERLENRSQLLEKSHLESVSINSKKLDISILEEILYSFENKEIKKELLSKSREFSEFKIDVDVNKVKLLSEKIKEIEKTYKKRDIVQSVISLSLIDYSKDYRQTIKSLMNIGVSLNKSKNINNLLIKSSVLKPVQLKDISKEKNISDLSYFIKSVESNYRYHYVLKKISNMKNINLNSSKQDYIENIKNSGLSVKKATDESKNMLDKIKQSEEEYLAIRKEIEENYPVCPTCHREWDHSH